MRTRTKYEDGPVWVGSRVGQVRSRSRANVNSPWTNWTGFSNVTFGAGLVPVEDDEAIIIDDIVPSNGVKTVTHTKRKFRMFNISDVDEFTDTNRYNYTGPYAHHYSWGYYGRILHSDLLPSYPKTISQLKTEAMHKFHKFNEVDTLLNLVESPQLVSSANSLTRLMREARRATSNRGRASALSKAASSGFLAWSFGLAPLISDVQKINAAVRQIKADMDRHIRDYNRRYVVTVKSLGTIAMVTTPTGYSSNPNLNNSSFWHVGINPLVPPMRLVGVKGRRNVEYSSDGFKRLDYVIRRFIATGPASLAWERIPFSFMLDWFVNLSGVVDALDNALTGNSRNIETVWMSEKWNTLVPVYKHKYVGWTSTQDGEQTAHNELSYYHREAISADPSISLSGRFGKKQVALTAALLHQLVANLRVWR